MTATAIPIADHHVRAPAAGLGRLAELDGLRGVAALVVVIHHAFLTVPSLAQRDRSPRPNAAGSPAWWMTYTPLHLCWDGTAAVFVFFVLSGFVLAAPAASGSRVRWRSYYPRRMARLYLPVWAAIGLALLSIRLVGRDHSAGASWWTSAHTGSPDTAAILRDVLLMRPGLTNTALWSLMWEVLFSLALPLFLLIATLLDRHFDLITAGLLLGAVAVGGYQGSGTYVYLPVFGLGVLMAFSRQANGSRAPWVLAGLRWRLPLAAGLALLSLNAYWYAVLLPNSRAGVALAQVIEVGGACTLVFLALTWRPLAAALGRRAAQWLGTRSFSLYLVHEPIIVSTAVVVRDGSRIVALLAIALPASLLAAELFYRFVERPALVLARRLGRSARPGDSALRPSGSPGRATVSETDRPGKSTAGRACRPSRRPARPGRTARP